MKFGLRWSFLMVGLFSNTQAFAHEYEHSNIGGNNLAWSCVGSSPPTTLLIAGMGLSAHESFGNTYHNYNGRTRLCMYDRAGIGESRGENVAVRPLKEIVQELRGLQKEAKWGEVILVAHSFGGFIARAFTDAYPEEVLGIVFLDSVHEDWFSVLKSGLSATDWALMERDVKWNKKNSGEDYYEAQGAVRQLGKLESLPITVISRGLMETNVRQGGMSYAGVDWFNASHRLGQTRLLELSKNNKHVIAHYANHFVDKTDPWLVLEELRDIQSRIRERRD